MTPIHAIATADPQQLRWVIGSDPLPPAGTVRRAPGRLGALLDSGVIDEMVVRKALSDALLNPAGWRFDASDNASQLAAIAAELLAGPIGALAASHGGSIELVSVTGDTVTVRMLGACHGCPAAVSTLHENLQRELRRRTGRQVRVATENDAPAMPLGRKLLSLLIR
jgi:NFU1 iron-sulfur cluster scaffold homolog, mitochondrial